MLDSYFDSYLGAPKLPCPRKAWEPIEKSRGQISKNLHHWSIISPAIFIFDRKDVFFLKLKMADKLPTSSEKDVLVDETKSDLLPQGPSNIIKVTTKGGKAIVVKREGDVQVQYKQELEKPDLRDFKLRPIEKFKEASQRKYSVVGITMEAKYDNMTESDEEREVSKLSKRNQAAHKEMKDLMTIQGRLKGQVPGFGSGIQHM